MLCFSVWPSAITRMCNYNLAQVKFNQSPQAQRNLRLPGKRRRRGREAGRKRKKLEKEKKGERGKTRERGFPAKGVGSCGSFPDELLAVCKFRLRGQRSQPTGPAGSGLRAPSKAHTCFAARLDPCGNITFFVLKIERKRKKGDFCGCARIHREKLGGEQ